MFYFLLLFGLFSSLFATQNNCDHIPIMANDPSVLIEGKINAITGSPCLMETDLVIQGAEPIYIQRSYVNWENPNIAGECKWNLNEITATCEKTNPSYRYTVAEKNGCPILFKKADTVHIGGQTLTRYVPSDLNKGFSNTWRGEISSRTNARNHSLYLRMEDKFLAFHAADGTVREYKKIHKSENPVTYRLLSEHLPNGRWILYDYSETTSHGKPKFRLTSIRTLNPSQTTVFAKADLMYEGPEKENPSYIVGSDGQTVKYSYREGTAGIITSIVSSSAPDQTLEYLKFFNETSAYGGVTWPKEQRLQTISFPLQRKFQIDYYKKEKENVAGKQIKMKDEAQGGTIPEENVDKRRSRIKTISAPVGPDSQLMVTHSFIYNLSPHTCTTSVYDIEGNRTDYVASGNYRLKNIERYSKDETFLSADCYSWGYQEHDGNLIAKTLVDAHYQPLFSKLYVYDKQGNVTEERFSGNLSGQGPSFSLDLDNKPIDHNAEKYIKRFQYTSDNPSLLTQEEEPSGKRTVYAYLPGTDLPTSRLIYDKQQLIFRTFYDYNADHILTKETNDDGNSPDKGNLTGITTRTIRQITPLTAQPYVGMPESIEEKYWENGHEIPLQKVIFTYTTGGRIAQQDIYDAENQFRYSLKTSYDTKGRPVSQINALGQEETYAYDACGNCIHHKDASGRLSTKTSYDCSNRSISESVLGDDGLSFESRYFYNTKHKLVSAIDPRGHETSFCYDALGRRSETNLPKIPTEKGELVQPQIHQAYDAANHETSRIDAENNLTQTTYNAYGKPTLIIHPDGAQESNLYNLDGTLKVHTDSKGVRTSYSYDFLGRIVSKTIASSNGILAEERFEYQGLQLLSKTDAEGNQTLYHYDGAGRKISEEFGGEKTTFAYDSLGRLHKTQTADLCTITEHDLLDRIIEEKQESSSGELLRWVAYSYDCAGNRTQITRNVAGKKALEQFSYDSIHRLIQKTDPLGAVETTIYEEQFTNSQGQKVLRKTHKDPLKLQTIETFNALGHIATIEKRNDKLLALEEKWHNRNGLITFQANTIFSPTGASHKVYTHWKYDNRCRLSALTEAVGTLDAKTTHHEYTPRGELAKTIKPDGTLLTYVYNELSHLTLLTSSDYSVRHEMAYNRLGNLLKSDSISRVLDPKGRILSETLPAGTIQSHYDQLGRRTSCQIPNANCLITYEYNPTDLHRLTRKTLDGNPLYTHTYTTHDLAGNLLEEQPITNHPIHYSFDPLSRKTQIQAPHFTQQVLAFDPVGNIRQMQIQEEEITYTYDPLYQLTSESGTFTHHYSYDSLHNRLRKDHETYQINALQQVVSHLEYDKNGNPVRQGNTQYTYDALDRLIQLKTPTLTQSFTYDSLHRCLSKTTLQNGQREVRHFLYDNQNEIGSLDEALNLKDLRILGHAPHAEIGAAVGIELQGKLYAPIHDLQGNIAVLLPIHHEEPSISRYSAFGEEKSTGHAKSPWRYSSKRTDERSGLVYYGRRFYSPELGRWLTPPTLTV